MKVNIRTVKQQKFEIEIDENETVGKLKEMIQQREGIDKSSQTLIFAGKFMEDLKPVKEYNITEKDFVVLTVKPQARTTTAPRTTTPTTTPPQTTTQTTTQPSTQTTISTPPTTTTPSTQTPSTTTPSSNPPSTSTPTSGNRNPEEELLTGPAYENMVNELTAMGFPKEEVVRALKLSFNNPTRAVEYLTGGFPDVEVEDQPPPQQQPTTNPPQQRTTTVPPTQTGSGHQPVGSTNPPMMGLGAQGGNLFATLRNHPLFIQMRALVQANPAYLEQLLGNIAQSSPELFQVIQQNQEQFVQFLNEPVSQEQLQQALAAGLGLGVGGQRAGPPPPGGQRQIQVQLTPEENEVVNNLVGMGFDRNKVLHYYILFEKDQEMTANYLLNYGFKEEEEDDQNQQ